MRRVIIAASILFTGQAFPAIAPAVQYFLGEISVTSPSGKTEPGGVSLAKRTLDPALSAIVEEVLHVPGRGPAEEHVSVMKVKGNRFLVSEANNRYQGAGSLVGKPWKWTSWEAWVRLEDGSGSFKSKHHLTAHTMISRREFYDPQGKLKLIFSEERKLISETVYDSLHFRLLQRGGGKGPLS